MRGDHLCPFVTLEEPVRGTYGHERSLWVTMPTARPCGNQPRRVKVADYVHIGPCNAYCVGVFRCWCAHPTRAAWGRLLTVRWVSSLLVVGAALCLAQVVTGASLVDEAAQDRAYCGWDAPGLAWVVPWMGIPAVAVVCFGASAGFLLRGKTATSRTFLYAAICPVLIRSCYGWPMPFVVASDGCEGDGGYIAPEGIILGAARPVIELIAIVGTYLILIVAIVGFTGISALRASDRTR